MYRNTKYYYQIGQYLTNTHVLSSLDILSTLCLISDV